MAWIFVILGNALLSTVHKKKSRGIVLTYQAFFSIGLGPLMTALPFPILAPLAAYLNTNALAFYSFVRFFFQVTILEFLSPQTFT